MEVDHQTVTFMNRNLDESEVRAKFQMYGDIVRLSNSNGRMFVKFSNAESAQNALSELGGELNAGLAHSRKSNNNPSRQDHRSSCADLKSEEGFRRDNKQFEEKKRENGIPSKNTETFSMGSKQRLIRNSSTRGEPESQSTVSSGRTENDLPVFKDFARKISSPVDVPIEPPALVECALDPFLVVLGNLPPNYLLDDVLGLVEEVKPIEISGIQQTLNMNLNYCQIRLRSLKDVLYLTKKLDNFILKGRSLIAVELKEVVNNLYLEDAHHP